MPEVPQISTSQGFEPNEPAIQQQPAPQPAPQTQVQQQALQNTTNKVSPPTIINTKLRLPNFSGKEND